MGVPIKHCTTTSLGETGLDKMGFKYEIKYTLRYLNNKMSSYLHTKQTSVTSL